MASMMKTALVLLLFAFAAFASGIPDGSWAMGTSLFGVGPDDMTATLNYDNELRLTIFSAGQSVFKLVTVFDSPTNASYQIEYDARVDAPGIDFDYGMDFSGGTEGFENDGPNLFTFTYDHNESTINNLPIPLTTLSWYDKYNSMCHVNMQCNYMGALDVGYDFYCRSPGTTYIYPGWVYDAYKFGSNVKVNEINAEAFPDSSWKTIRLYIDQGECKGPKVTLMVMGADTVRDKSYTWEFKNFRIVTAEETIPISLNHVYRYDKNTNNYTRVAKPQFCGDGIREGTEECDGEDGVDDGWSCTPNCRLVPLCGDNRVVGDEVCDGTSVPDGFECADDCMAMSPVCGDGLIVGDEVCDGENVPEGFECADDCLSMSPICGDGIVVGTEECDGPGTTEEGYGCTEICTVYRILSDEEQEGVGAIIELIKSSEPGVPSNARVVIPRGTYSSKDFADQFTLRGETLDGTVKFCTPGTLACEADYVLVEDAMAAQTSMSPVDDLRGIAKVYKAEENGTISYYVGFKGGVGLIPRIEMDTTMWIVVGILVLLILIAGIALLLILGGYIYFTKSGGISIKKFFK